MEAVKAPQKTVWKAPNTHPRQPATASSPFASTWHAAGQSSHARATRVIPTTIATATNTINLSKRRHRYLNLFQRQLGIRHN
jgi:hypothetical protein